METMPVNCTSLEEVKRLSVAEINKLTSPQLKLAIAALIGDENARPEPNQPSNADLMVQLQEIKEEVQGIHQLRQQVEDLKEENKQIKEDLRTVFEILHHQQLFTESVEQRDRLRYLIVTGISEDPDELGNNDHAKLRSVLQAVECDVDLSGCELQRWADAALRRRPI